METIHLNLEFISRSKSGKLNFSNATQLAGIVAHRIPSRGDVVIFPESVRDELQFHGLIKDGASHYFQVLMVEHDLIRDSITISFSTLKIGDYE